MAPIARCDSRQLLDLAALSDFLVRSRQSGAAVVATDRLADALLAYERSVATIDRTAGNSQRREALRLRAEVALLNRRLRRGPVRHLPGFRRRVETLLLNGIAGYQDDEVVIQDRR
jgi:hypothetical protein